MLRASLRWTTNAQARPCKNALGRLTRRGLASVTDVHQYPEPGVHIHGFTLKRTKHVPELQLTAFHLEHEKTGAEYLHVARTDKNNVFSVGFKTNPPDDTGVPHILEHTTLCGSQKYVDQEHGTCAWLTLAQVSRQRSLLQNATPIAVEFHERFYVFRSYVLPFCNH